MVRDLLRLFEVASVSRTALEGALALRFDGFEDAVLQTAGRFAGAGAVVTRRPSGFPAPTLRVYDPDTFTAVRGRPGREQRPDHLP